MTDEPRPRPASRTSRRAFLAGASTSLAWVAVGGVGAPFLRQPRPGLDVESMSLTDGVAAFRADGTTPVTVGPGWATRVDLPMRGPMITLGWDGANDAELRVRGRGPDSWSSWVQVVANPDEAPDPGSGEGNGRAGVGPIWVGDGTETVEIELVSGQISGVRLDTLRPRDPGPSWFGLTAAAAAPAGPGIIRRSTWGAGDWASENGNCGPGPRHADRLERIIVHHTVNVNDYTATEARDLIRGIYHHHVNNNGWCDIAYNYLIDRFGNIYEGRTGSLHGPVIGGHAAGFNTGSVGIALLGQHHPGSSPPAVPVSNDQRRALRRLMAWICGEYGLDARAARSVVSLGSTRYPRDTRAWLSTVVGHRDVTITSCPGDNVHGHLASLREEVQHEVIHSMPFPLPRWRPEPGQAALFALDAYGGLHPAGGQGVLHPRQRNYWSGWKIARSAVRMDVGGYILDAYGGLHGFGRTPAVRPSFYQPGNAICVDVARGPEDHSGWVLDRHGRLHPFGGAPALAPSATWPGRNIARAVETIWAGTGGYVLDAFGALHRFGNVPVLEGSEPRWPSWDMARDFCLRPDGTSGWILDAWGGIHAFGGAPKHSSPAYQRDVDHGRGIVASPDGVGGWVMDRDGFIHAFGGAPEVYHRSTWRGVGIGRALLIRRDRPTLTETEPEADEIALRSG